MTPTKINLRSALSKMAAPPVQDASDAPDFIRGKIYVLQNIYTAISIKVVPKTREKVEYERERLIGKD